MVGTGRMIAHAGSPDAADCPVSEGSYDPLGPQPGTPEAQGARHRPRPIPKLRNDSHAPKVRT